MGSVVLAYTPSTTRDVSIRTKPSPKQIDKTIAQYLSMSEKPFTAGARKGAVRPRAIAGLALANRLNQHATSIDQANNLKLSDFSCRYLVVDDIWIPLGESLLIERFSPIWNTRIDGFGNHAPGRGRQDQARSQWDVLHSGRPWATKLKSNMTLDDVVKRLWLI